MAEPKPNTTQQPTQNRAAEASAYRGKPPKWAPKPLPNNTRPPAGVPQYKVNLQPGQIVKVRDVVNKPGYWQGPGPDYHMERAEVGGRHEGDSFFENPQRVARYYQAAKSLPAGVMPKLDVQSLEVAYNYLKARNGGKPPELWATDAATDTEYRSFVAGIAPPPVEAMLPREQAFWGPRMLREQMAAAGIPTMQPGEYQPPEQMEDMVFGMPARIYDNLPDWQKAVIPMLPWVNRVSGVVGGAIAGTGVAPGVGTVAGAIAGGGLAYGSEQNQQLADLLMKLDIPAEYFERAMGVLSQGASSLINPEEYGSFQELIQNLPAAWEASRVTYESSFANTFGNDIQGWEGVWQAPNNQVASEWALFNARKEIMAGASSDEVYAKYSQMFGLSGQLQDMVGHMFLDPLNLIGPATNKVGGKLADVAGNKPLAAAFKMESETLPALQQYGRMLRQMPKEEAMRFGAMSRWIAGLDEMGNIKELSPNSSKFFQNPLDYMRGLTPASRASEVLNTTVDGLSTFLNDYGGDNPALMVKLVQSLANASPRNAVDALDGSPLPRWFSSAEAQHVPVAIREALPKIEGLLQTWEVTRGNAKIIERVAGFMGQTPSKLMADLHNATPKEAADIWRAFVDNLSVKAQNDQNAAKLLQTITSDSSFMKLDGQQLKKMADNFLDGDGVAFHPKEFQARVITALAESADEWAAKYFDVKPAGWAVRLSNTVKRAQSLALLGLNPSYMLNNALNNIVTLSWDGLLRLNTHGSRVNWLKDMGISPSRIREGLGGAELGSVAGELGKAIRKAGKAGDALQSLDDFVKAVTPDKLAVFASASAKIEQATSEIAMVTAMREMWNKTWREGAGYDRMPNQLRQVLNDFQPGLAEKVEKAIRRGKSQQQIQKEIFDSLSRKSLHDVLSNAEKASFDSRFPGVFDDLEADLAKATTNEEVHQSFAKARQTVQESISKQIEDAQARLVEEAANKARLEQEPGVFDMIDDLMSSKTDFDLAHFDRMDAVAREAEKYLGPARQALWDNALREEDRAYSQFNNIYASKWMGIYQGLGADRAARDYALARLWDLRDNYGAFYTARRDLMNEFFDFAYGTDDKAARSAKWQEINEKLNTEYLDMIIEEDRIQGMMNQHLADTFGERMGMRDQAEQWRGAILEVRRQQQAAMIAYRSGEIPERLLKIWGPDVLPATIYNKIYAINQGQAAYKLNLGEREAAAKRFYKEVYVPLIKDALEASNKNVPVQGAKVEPKAKPAQPDPVIADDLAQTTTPDDGAMPDVEPVDQSVEQFRSQLRTMAHDYDPEVTADQHIINIVNKHTGEKVKKLEDITIDQMRRAFETRTKSKIPDEQRVTTVRSGMLSPDERIISRSTGLLPQNVREPIARLAKELLDDMGGDQGSVTILETNSRVREGSTIYWSLYDATPKNQRSTFKRKYTNALTQIVVGRDNPADEVTGRIKQAILSMLTGESNHDLHGYIGDPAVMWFTGRKNKAAEHIENHMQGTDNETLLKTFGNEKTVDEVLAYYIEWLEKSPEERAADDWRAPVQEPEPQPVMLSEPAAVSAETSDVPSRPVEPIGPAEQRSFLAPVGTVDSVSEPPLEMAALEGWLKELGPVLERAESGLTGDAVQYNVKDLDPEVTKALKGYLGKVYSQLTDTKMGALRWGEMRRDAALLNYSKRYGFDNVLGTVMPYEFWMTRSMVTWALRALNKPSILANYARLRTFSGHYTEREGFPTRLKKKMGIAVPFLPEWMGEGVFIDPLKQIFPFENLTSPWQKLADQNNLEQRRAEGVIRELLGDETITPEEADEALRTRSGAIWDRAMARARNEIDADIENPVDFAQTMSGFSLPVNWAYQAAMGRADRIGQLPVTRGVQAITGALGIGGPRGVNLEGGIRRMLDLPEIDRNEDFRIERMLANLTAEGLIPVEEAQRAMIDKTGPAYEMAQQRVSQMGLYQYLGAPLGVDFFPEGEQKQRALQKEYDTMIQAWKAGDDKAYGAFFDKYPEYEARKAWFREPEEKLRAFLRSEIWEQWNALPGLHKKEIKEQLGDTFVDAFLTRETRAYDSIDTKTYAMWARMLGADTPEATPDVAALPLKLADPNIAAAVEAYNTEREQLFPTAGQLNSLAFALPQEASGSFRNNYPELKDYSKWRNAYLSQHPEIIPYVTGDTGEMAGYPPELQQQVFQYKAMKDQYWPNLDQMQSEYFSITDRGQKKAYLQQHPELKEYWEFRTQYAAANPRIAAFIIGDDKVSQAIEPNPDYAMIAEAQQQFSPQLARQMMGHMYANQNLTAGAKQELRRIWTELGRPLDTFDAWLERVKANYQQ